jgi:hypothetical protein
MIYEITLAFIAATIISCILICTKICIGQNENEPLLMQNNANNEVIESYPSFEGNYYFDFKYL